MWTRTTGDTLAWFLACIRATRRRSMTLDCGGSTLATARQGHRPWASGDHQLPCWSAQTAVLTPIRSSGAGPSSTRLPRWLPSSFSPSSSSSSASLRLLGPYLPFWANIFWEPWSLSSHCSGNATHSSLWSRSQTHAHRLAECFLRIW